MEWISTTLTWYLYVFAIGIVFLPFTARIFHSFVDKGYPFSKTIGIVLTTYIVYILGIIKAVPFTKETIFFLLIILAFVFYKYLNKGLQEIRRMTKRQILLLVGEEILFLAGLFFLVIMRGQEPSIRGLEKFMDFGFIQAILRSNYFPPLDMWLSADPSRPNGYSINYYYFGHLSGALLIKLSNITAFKGYNLILATILAQGLTLAFSLTSNIVYITQKYIVKKYIHPFFIILFGLVGSFLVNLAGNLHTIYLFTTGYPNESPEPFWKLFQSGQQITQTMEATGLPFLDAMIRNSNYWYPNATRFIPFTIHEFPSYSYVVADLHGHVFDIPFVLVTIAMLFVFLIHNSVPELYSKLTLTSWLKKNAAGVLKVVKPWISKQLSVYEVVFAVFIGFFIAIHYMTNAFDGPIYFLLALLVFFALYKLTKSFFILSGVLAVSFITFSIPFSTFFDPFVSGIGVNCSPNFLVNLEKIGPFMFEKGNCQLSQPWMMFVLWGLFWISFVIYAVFVYLYSRNNKKKDLFSPLDHWLLISFGFGTFLILIPEFFYIKDIYPAHFRANTMFKMGYQAYIIMSLASAIVVYRIGLWKSRITYILRFIYIPFFILVFVYPFIAFPSYYPITDITERDPVLDGSQWLDIQYPENKEIIMYIENNIPNQPVILEAQGDSYTDFNHISAYTGIPTVAGWWVHEWLWRGSADIVGKRIPDIITVYESEDVEETKKIIEKYNIEYIVVSKLEREKYPKLNEQKIQSLGTKVFESKNKIGALYRVY